MSMIIRSYNNICNNNDSATNNSIGPNSNSNRNSNAALLDFDELHCWFDRSTTGPQISTLQPLHLQRASLNLVGLEFCFELLNIASEQILQGASKILFAALFCNHVDPYVNLHTTRTRIEQLHSESE